MSKKIKKEDGVSNEVKSNYISATTNSSNITRNLALAMIASIWAISYKDGTFEPSQCLQCALITLFVFLIIDVLQYFFIAIFSFCFFKSYTREECTKDEHEKKMTCLSNWAFKVFGAKHIIVLIATCYFIRGFIYQFNLN